MEGDGIDRKDNVPASLTSAVAFEGVLAALDLLAVVKVLHGNPAFNRAQGISSAIWIASYAPCLVLEGGLPCLLRLARSDAANSKRGVRRLHQIMMCLQAQHVAGATLQQSPVHQIW